MRDKNVELLVAVGLVMVLALVVATGCAAEKNPSKAPEKITVTGEVSTDPAKQTTRLQELQQQHRELLEKRAQWIRAMATLDKIIIKLEGKIEEQQWVEEQKGVSGGGGLLGGGNGGSK